MRTSMQVLSVLMIAGTMTGCASMCHKKSGGELDQLRGQVQMLEDRLGTVTASQADLQKELKELTETQQGLRQQLETLAQQRKKAAPAPVDEK